MKDAIRTIVDFLDKNDKIVEAALVETMYKELLMHRNQRPYTVKKTSHEN